MLQALKYKIDNLMSSSLLFSHSIFYIKFFLVFFIKIEMHFKHQTEELQSNDIY